MPSLTSVPLDFQPWLIARRRLWLRSCCVPFGRPVNATLQWAEARGRGWVCACSTWRRFFVLNDSVQLTWLVFVVHGKGPDCEGEENPAGWSDTDHRDVCSSIASFAGEGESGFPPTAVRVVLFIELVWFININSHSFSSLGLVLCRYG